MTDTGGAEPALDTPAWGTNRATWTERNSLEAEQAVSLASITENRLVEADCGAGLRALDAALGWKRQLRRRADAARPARSPRRLLPAAFGR